jgi:hypothetical protein
MIPPEGPVEGVPEGPGAARCEVCGRPLDDGHRGDESCERMIFGWNGTGLESEANCYRLGYERLRARLVEVERERDEARERLRAALSEEETALRELNLSIADGKWSVEMAVNHPRFFLLCAAIAQFFKSMGATNYVEFQLSADGLGPIVFTVQRMAGKRPSEIASEEMARACAASASALQAEGAARTLREALRPFAEFDVPTDYRRKGYRGTVYATHMGPGKTTEITVDDFDRARLALSGLPPLTSETVGPVAALREELRIERQWSAEKGEERDRLQEVLREIARGHDGPCCASAKDCGTAMADFAREALAPAPPTPAALVPKEEATPSGLPNGGKCMFILPSGECAGCVNCQ